MKPCAVCLCVLVLVTSVCAFNVDTVNTVKHTGEPGSMFGFSVAEHRERGASWVMVGAPNAETGQPGVLRGGAVYRCDINRNDCRMVPFDRTGNNNNSEGIQIDKKSYQWFGATVRSSGEDGIVLACAPRYVWYSYLNRNQERRDPVGTCFVAKNQFSEVSEYSPCRTRNWGYHRQGSCQAGLGADISKDGLRLFIGGVGSWYWQGQLHSIDSLAHLQFLPPRYSIFKEGQLISQNLHTRPDVISTNEGPETDDDSYLGYSVAAGDFSGGGGHNDVAVGMPRGAQLKGKIVLFTWNTTNLDNITGEQMGSYFGYSLAVADMNGDKLDDLIIGAPLYTDLGNNEGDYETGRVYVIYQEKGTHKFRSAEHRDGFNSKSRFGLALCSLSDINRDGFGDIAIGAPYDGPNERGIVYIFHGSPNGIREKPSQIITTEDIGQHLTTFGFSLAGGIDLDGNQYPDLVIGAYESDTSVFLKARPVVEMEASIVFEAEQKQVILEEQNCTLKDSTRVACLSLLACLKYNGLGVDDVLDFDVQIILDSKKSKSPRMYFLSEEGRFATNHTLRLEKGRQRCKPMLVYIKPSIRDKLTTLEAELKYALHDAAFAQRRYYRSLIPILDMNEPLVRKDSVSIQKNCGKDNICIPDLRLITIPSVKRYLLGSGERLIIEVLAENEGEDSFESTFEMQVPPGINYINIERIDDAEREIPVQCSAPSFVNNNTLHCDIGNPLPKEKLVHFKVLLQPFHKEGMKARYEFLMYLNSTNPENNQTMSDNVQVLSVPIWVETDLILQGSSHPGEVHYNTTLYNLEKVTQESEIGPQVVHIYSIRNKGPSDILEAEAHFLWPSKTLAGDHLLYLLEQPETSGPIRCEFINDANPLHLKLDRKRKSYLESSGIGVQSGLTSSSSFSSSSSSSSSGIVIEESSSFSSSSKSSRKKGSKIGGKVLTAEEKRRLEEEARRKDEEDARAETGDGSLRHSKRIKDLYYRKQMAGEFGGEKEVWNKGDSSSKGIDRTSGFKVNSRERVEGAGVRVNNNDDGRGTKILERGRVEISGGGLGGYTTQNAGDVKFETKLEEDYYKSYGSSQGGRQYKGGNIEPEIGVAVNRGRYGSNERRYEVSHSAQGGVSGASESGKRNQGNYNSGQQYAGAGAVNHTYSKEGHSYSNTTWNSKDGGKPLTHSGSSWRINEDGVIRNGSTSSVHEGERNEHERRISGNFNSGQQYAGSGVGNHTFAKEDHSYSNTTWSSGDGGRPVTHTGTSWRIEEDGVVRNGSNFRVYEGDVNYGREVGGSQSLGSNYDASRATGNRGVSAAHDWRDVAKNDTRRGYGSHTASQDRSSTWQENTRQYEGSNAMGRQGGSSQYDGFATVTQGSRDSGGARAYNFDIQGNTGRSQQTGSSSSSFDSLAGIALGPKDGVAKTYTFNVENNNDGTRHHSSGSEYGSNANKTWTSGSKHYSSAAYDAERDNVDYDSYEDTDHRNGQVGKEERRYIGRDNVDYDNIGTSGYSSSSRWSTASRTAGENARNRGGTYTSSQSGGDYTGGHVRTRTYQQSHMEENQLEEPDEENSRFKLYPRYKRQVENGQEDLGKSLQCGPTSCTRVKCVIGPLTKDQEAGIAFRSRVWVQTLKKFAYNPEVQLSSLVGGKVTKLPHIGSPDQAYIHTHEVMTQVLPRETGVKPEVVPLWIVVVSACAGAIILMLLVYLLYKCGFFKRNRPSNVPEKEPLNRNGHYQNGDEAL